MLELAEMTKQEMNYDTAWLYCLTLDSKGHYDWRLPTHIEYFRDEEIEASWYENKHVDSNLLWKCQPVRGVQSF